MGKTSRGRKWTCVDESINFSVNGSDFWWTLTGKISRGRKCCADKSVNFFDKWKRPLVDSYGQDMQSLKMNFC